MAKRFSDLQTEIPENMRPTARTIATLLTLEKKGVVRLQFDDSPQAYETREQLKEIAGNVGYEFISRNDHLAYLIDNDYAEER